MNIVILIFEFLKIGLLALGGGMSTIPFLFELSRKYPSWFSEKELADMISVSESTPGPIGINMSTYCGFRVAGVLGGVISTLSLVLPSFIVIFLISKRIDLLKKPVVKNAMYGLRPVVVVLFISALFNIFRLTFFKGGVNLFSLSLGDLRMTEIYMFAIIFTLSSVFKKVANIYWVLFAGVVSLFIF